MTISWSYGGGVQSVAIGVLVREGALPRPDIIGIADTSREVSTTWEYLYEHMQPYLDPIGLKIEVVPHTLSRVDLLDKDGLTLMPAYTKTVTRTNGLFGPQESVAKGRLPSFCSGEWKRDTMERWLRLKGVKTCDQWIGYSIDEKARSMDRYGRPKKDHRPWCHVTYPLIEKRMTRQMCLSLIEAAGLPLPKKSRCWCCPHQSPEEWLEIKSRPEEFSAAVAIEKHINENDPQQAGLYLYAGAVPLAEANFVTDTAASPPAAGCEIAGCWT